MSDPAGGESGAGGSDVADMVMGMRYVDRFERRAGEWRIARRELRWEWVRTDRLEGLDPSWTLGRSDGRDPVHGGPSRVENGVDAGSQFV